MYYPQEKRPCPRWCCLAALNYAVLYEGVESDSDERMCMGMDASYLQGYKYSRPVPITALEKYCRTQD